MIQELWQRLRQAASAIGATPDDDEETQLKRAILVVTTVLISIAGAIWGLLYISAGAYLAASIPLSYSVLSIINLYVVSKSLRFDIFRTVQIGMTLLLPLLLMLVLGGYVTGSAVILWSFLAPLGALLCWDARRAIQWYLVFVASVVVVGLLVPYLPAGNLLSDAMITTFYVINIAGVTAVAFFILIYFVRQKDLALRLMQRNRELERANMEQELLLRQSEKLATLGRLSAGVAHELNNPAAAAQRGAMQLMNIIDQLKEARLQLGRMELTPAQHAALAELEALAAERARSADSLSPIERSDREYAIETHLEENGLEDGWEYAPTLVNMNYQLDDITALSARFRPEQLPAVIASLSNGYAAQNLLEEVHQGAGRIAEIVGALKTYTYLDQAPEQFLNVHDGLDNTLVMLRSKLKQSVNVHRDYDRDIACVLGYGSELNQVWTNIIDNAVDAMQGQGDLHLRTRQDGAWVCVEITDSGPGIPPEIEPYIFDPFYTTKSLGQGSGLGLNISHNIIVQKHKGQIAVRSRPGETTFTVKLPQVEDAPTPAEGTLEMEMQ